METACSLNAPRTSLWTPSYAFCLPPLSGTRGDVGSRPSGRPDVDLVIKVAVERRILGVRELNLRVYTPVRTPTRHVGSIRTQNIWVDIDRFPWAASTTSTIPPSSRHRPAPGSDATWHAHPRALSARPPLLATATSRPGAARRAGTRRPDTVLATSGLDAALQTPEHLGPRLYAPGRTRTRRGGAIRAQKIQAIRADFMGVRPKSGVPRPLRARPAAYGRAAWRTRSWASRVPAPGSSVCGGVRRLCGRPRRAVFGGFRRPDQESPRRATPQRGTPPP
ncbi:hypothetical protein VTO73DRAFT_6586 [Trametes versicolor]